VRPCFIYLPHKDTRRKMAPRKDESEYVLYVSNLSSSTRSRDIKDEFEHTAGRVYKIERDYKSRSALVEMDNSPSSKTRPRAA